MLEQATRRFIYMARGNRGEPIPWHQRAVKPRSGGSNGSTLVVIPQDLTMMVEQNIGREMSDTYFRFRYLPGGIIQMQPVENNEVEERG